MSFLAIGVLAFLALACLAGVALLFVSFPLGVCYLVALGLFCRAAWRGAQKDIHEADAGRIPTGQRAPGPFWR